MTNEVRSGNSEIAKGHGKDAVFIVEEWGSDISEC